MRYPHYLTPLEETEEIQFCGDLPIQFVAGFILQSRSYADHFKWICYCGAVCRIPLKQIRQGTIGGNCQCSRQYVVFSDDGKRYVARRIPA